MKTKNYKCIDCDNPAIYKMTSPKRIYYCNSHRKYFWNMKTKYTGDK
jgi:hypothetical protein